MANPGLGYVLLWRDVVEGPLWNNGKPFSEGQAWIQFILWAEFQEDTQFINNQMVTLKPGEFMMTQRKMAESMNWTQPTVNRYLKKLVKMNQCCIKTESKMTRVSLVNWEVRQVQPSKLIQTVNQKPDFFDGFLGPDNTITSNNSTIINNNNTKETNKTNNNNRNTKKVSSNKGVVQGSKYKASPKDLQMVIDYFIEKEIPDAELNATKFYSHYESVGWYRGRTKIRNWKMCLNQWDFTTVAQQPATPGKKVTFISKWKKYKTGAYEAFCSSCGNREMPAYEWQLRQGSSCCAVEYTPTKPGNDNVEQKSKERQTRQAQPAAGRRTTTRSGEHISDVFSSLSQQR